MEDRPLLSSVITLVNAKIITCNNLYFQEDKSSKHLQKCIKRCDQICQCTGVGLAQNQHFTFSTVPESIGTNIQSMYIYTIFP